MCLLLFAQLWNVTCTVWNVIYLSKKEITLKETESFEINFKTNDLSRNDLNSGKVVVHINDVNIATVNPTEYILNTEILNDSFWRSSFNITGNFLGRTSVYLAMSHTGNSQYGELKESEPLSIKVIRKQTVMDKLFTMSVIILVAIIFVNFGCALDVSMLKRAVTRPIGPVIGLVNHFFLLPLISYGMGLLLFPGEGTRETALRLGLFFTAVSPAGGASNIWTYLLGGNLNLSITMTAVSTLASFLMIPAWTLTLGRVIFSGGSMGVPYQRITTSAVGLFVPLVIGYIIQIYFKKLADKMVRILKPFSAFLIAFIIVFAIVTNSYLFQLFTWQIAIAGFGLPLIGYSCGLLLAALLMQPGADVTAISIETGVQNTGIAIFLLRFCLEQPEADLTTGK
ncbi:hypothetical protein AAG570_010392 [Ranatra chinensis]|uniref:Solute carrier family 10 member 6 n=1 Tax=Ranatra chinensis TaxID=642074 RepID=A0ABD0YMJ1_9HEMI